MLENIYAILIMDETCKKDLIQQQGRLEQFPETDEMMTRVRSHSGGLVETVWYMEKRIVQLIHQSAFDFLLDVGFQLLEASICAGFSGTVEARSHFWLAKTSIRYFDLCSQISYIEQQTSQLKQHLRMSPISRKVYDTSETWPVHLKAVEKNQLSVADLLLPFHPPSNFLNVWCQKAMYPGHDDISYDQQAYCGWLDVNGRTILHVIAGLGLSSALEDAIIAGLPADLKNERCRTPLSFAAEAGYKAMVAALMERSDVVANSKDRIGRTPLAYAAREGRTEIVKMLMDRPDFVADLRDRYGRSPLSQAARYGHAEVFNALLGLPEVAADSKDNSSRTPLSYAAEYGEKEVVQMLLELDQVAADSSDKDGRTPLSHAAKYSDDALAQMLLERGIVADSMDKDGRMPLYYAALGANVKFVRCIIHRKDVSESSRSQASEIFNSEVFKNETLRDISAERRAT